MSFPRYPAYKDSGVEWLGEVPEHWEVLRISRLFEIKAGGDLKNDYFSDSKTDIYRYPIYTNTIDDKAIYGYTSKPIFPANTITVTGRGGIGYAIYRDHSYDAIIRLLVLKPIKPITPKLYAYLINAIIKFSEGNSAIAQLSAEQISPYKVLLAPIQEQTTITAFLDCETAKIDNLINEQKKLIELLKEKRQAVISIAVTKGLNPHAPMKDSGVEWLGEVPEGWEVLPIRRLSNSVQTGGTPSTGAPSSDTDNSFLWYTPADFGEALVLTTSSRSLSQECINNAEVKIFPANSVLVVSIGATLGKVGFTKQPSSANQQINAITPNHRIDGYYLAYSLVTKTDVMRFLSNASTIGIMNQEKTKDIIVVVPPLNEQIEISNFLDQETAKIDNLIQQAQKATTLLQERRTALISAAVTGKIDVRGFVTTNTTANCVGK